MASRFVSAGGAELKAPEGLSTVTDDAWAKAKKQVEEGKKPVQEGPASGTQEGGISLFEHLQNQKAAKQEAFEEASKLRNQFRPLDDGEVDFLESIKQKERLKAAAERQETAEQLEAFRRAQVDAEDSLGDALVADPAASTDVSEDTVIWTTTKKRRKPDPSGKPEPAKIRRLSSETSAQSNPKETKYSQKLEATTSQVGGETASTMDNKNSTGNAAAIKAPTPAKTLISYDSDSDD